MSWLFGVLRRASDNWTLFFNHAALRITTPLIAVMGGNISSKLEEFEQDLSFLDINRVEMKMFYKVFCKMGTVKDQDYVTVTEILKYAKIPYSHFAARALCCGFCYVSASESEENERKMLAEYKFDFRNFVFTLWNLLTLCPEVFINFIFSVYDADGGGSIDPQEAQILLKEMHGDDFESNLDVVREYNKFAMLVRKNINLEKFQCFAEENPKVFLPAVELQKKLASCILGTVYWYVRTKKRKQMYGLLYKHVTRVVDKVRIVREKEMEENWGRGGKGNKKYYLPKNQQTKQQSKEEKELPPPSSPQNIFIVDNTSPLETGSVKSESGKKRRGLKSMVSFADDVNDNSSPATPSKAVTTKSSTSKYFFGSRPNTPSKQISYFLDKFYEKPGEVKVTADNQEALVPYSQQKT